MKLLSLTIRLTVTLAIYAIVVTLYAFRRIFLADIMKSYYYSCLTFTLAMTLSRLRLS